MTTRIHAVEAPTNWPALEITDQAHTALTQHGWQPPDAAPTHHQLETTTLQRIAAQLDHHGKQHASDSVTALTSAAGVATEEMLE